MRELCFPQGGVFLLCRCILNFGYFLVVLALPLLLVALFGDSLGVRQNPQLREMLPPGFLFFRGEPNTVLRLLLRFTVGGRRMMVMGGKDRRGGGRENGKCKQGGIKAHREIGPCRQQSEINVERGDQVIITHYHNIELGRTSSNPGGRRRVFRRPDGGLFCSKTFGYTQTKPSKETFHAS